MFGDGESETKEYYVPGGGGKGGRKTQEAVSRVSKMQKQGRGQKS